MTDETEVWVLVNQGPSIPWPEYDHLIGTYLKHQDVNAREGRGEAVWTEHVDEAQKFSSFAEAFEEWRKQSDVTPLRDDGMPNRPLTAFSIEPRRHHG